MPQSLVVAAAVVGVVVLVVLLFVAERVRRNRRFARKLSPYVRRRVPGGEVLDTEDWLRRH